MLFSPVPRLTVKYRAALLRLLAIEGLPLGVYFNITLNRGRGYLYSCLRRSYGYKWDSRLKRWVSR